MFYLPCSILLLFVLPESVTQKFDLFRYSFWSSTTVKIYVDISIPIILCIHSCDMVVSQKGFHGGIQGRQEYKKIHSKRSICFLDREFCGVRWLFL